MSEIIWTPLKGSQTLALSCPAQEILYDGTRGPGKSEAQLMRFRMRVGLGYGKFWRGVIFDRRYKNLDDIVAKSLRWFPRFKDGARWIASTKDYKWVWPSGEELLFRVLERPADYWDYHGQEYPYIGWNELTKYPTPELYELMISCNRSSFIPENYKIEEDGVEKLLPEIPLEIFSTCNPFGAGHGWVKKEFIDGAKPGEMRKSVTVVFNPRTCQYEDYVRLKVRIFGSWRENKYLSPAYIATLQSIKDPNKKKAWGEGNWDVTSGGMFDDLWDSSIHIVEPFQIPANWQITRSFDYGQSKPFSVGWWAIADGSDIVLPSGKILNTIRGDVFRIGEWYGSTGSPNQGLNLLAYQIAEGIVRREIHLGIHGRVSPGPADSSIYNTSNGNCIAEDMEAPVKIGDKVYPGVMWEKSDKSPGSRVIGWEKCRVLLDGALTYKLDDGSFTPIKREDPGMFTFSTCPKFIELFPTTNRDETNTDDVDTESEDHLQDEVRYFVLGLSYVTVSRVIGQH